MTDPDAPNPGFDGLVTDFGMEALPYGVFVGGDGRGHLCAGVGTDLIDLASGADRLGDAVDPDMLRTGSLNQLLAAGSQAWADLRQALGAAVASGALDAHRLPQAGAEMRLAWEVADFVDFYSSIHHAENVGSIFRPDAEPLLPNWRHLPVAYHGRAGTVYVDGTPVRRPRGQRKEPDGKIVFGPSERLDFEVEMGWVLGGRTDPGEPVSVEAAGDHVFGAVLLNDWSARDIQAWEYVPLGPFLGKSFATTVSAWVMPLAALETGRVAGPAQDPTPFNYLRTDTPWAFAIDLVTSLTPDEGEPVKLAGVNAADNLYWSVAQQLAHLTVNGATVRPGDLLGTGTISGPDQSQRGSLLELTWNGIDPIDVGGGAVRTFLADGDTVTITASFPGPDGPVPFGPVTGRIVSA